MTKPPLENLIAQWLSGAGYDWTDVQKACDLLDYLKTQGYEINQEIPQVEVTDTRTSDRSLVRAVSPESYLEARRSGAKNVSAPAHQKAFISEARASLGQPGARDCQALVNHVVTLVFNVDKDPVTGLLTEVVDHPSAPTTYLILDNDSHFRYPLNSIQEIKT